VSRRACIPPPRSRAAIDAVATRLIASPALDERRDRMIPNNLDVIATTLTG
jgi:hypothetical protein